MISLFNITLSNLMYGSQSCLEVMVLKLTFSKKKDYPSHLKQLQQLICYSSKNIKLKNYLVKDVRFIRCSRPYNDSEMKLLNPSTIDTYIINHNWTQIIYQSSLDK